MHRWCDCGTELTAPLFLSAPLFLLPFASTSPPPPLTFHYFLCSPSSLCCHSHGWDLAPVTQMHLILCNTAGRVFCLPSFIQVLRLCLKTPLNVQKWRGCVLSMNVLVNTVNESCSGWSWYFPLRGSESMVCGAPSRFHLRTWDFGRGVNPRAPVFSVSCGIRMSHSQMHRPCYESERGEGGREKKLNLHTLPSLWKAVTSLLIWLNKKNSWLLLWHSLHGNSQQFAPQSIRLIFKCFHQTNHSNKWIAILYFYSPPCCSDFMESVLSEPVVNILIFHFVQPFISSQIRHLHARSQNPQSSSVIDLSSWVYLPLSALIMSFFLELGLVVSVSAE